MADGSKPVVNLEAPSKSLADLFNGLPFRRFAAKQILFFQGDPINKIYYILSGYVRMYNITPRGSERTLLILGPGDSPPIIQTPEALYFYDAFTDIYVAQGTLEEITKRFLADETYMAVARDAGIKLLKRMMSQMEVVSSETANEKIEKIIQFLGEYYGETSGEYNRICFKLTHQDLANLINLTRETVSQNITKLSKKKLIKLGKDGHILVKQA
jgi:CRP/FNR family transcriptional regulator